MKNEAIELHVLHCVYEMLNSVESIEEARKDIEVYVGAMMLNGLSDEQKAMKEFEAELIATYVENENGELEFFYKEGY